MFNTMQHFFTTLDDIYDQIAALPQDEHLPLALEQLVQAAIQWMEQVFPRNHFALTALRGPWLRCLQEAQALEAQLPSRLQEIERIRQGVLNELYGNLFFGI